MPIVNGYTDFATLAADPQLMLGSDVSAQTVIEGIIEGVSREIDLICSRYFYKNTVDETRRFSPRDPDHLWVGDLLSVTSLKTDDGTRTFPYTWAAGDFELWPYNIALDNNYPYMRIDVTPTAHQKFQPDKGSTYMAQIVGKWGWPSVPKIITEACILWSMRTYLRHKTVLGVSGTSMFGTSMIKVPPPDPDVENMLNKFQMTSMA